MTDAKPTSANAKDSDAPGSQAEIAELVRRARAAQAAISGYSQEALDALVTSVGWQVVKHRERLAHAAVDEGGFGNVGDKIGKIKNRVTGTLNEILAVKTTGVIDEIPERGLVLLGKPVGVVAALIPTTGPDATPPVKALCALKCGNAIIVSPHPRTVGSTALVVDVMRQGCEVVGAPADLVQIVTRPSIAKTQELMRQADLVVATGGAGMVKAAYSSGTPAYGVGVGNAVHVVDETADLADAALMIARAKTFDYATSCLADNAVVAHASIVGALREKLGSHGAYFCNADEKARLAKALWPGASHIPTLEVIAKPVSTIASLARLDVPADRSFLVVEEDGFGPDCPFSGEKLSVVLALYTYDGGIEEAVAIVDGITSYQGLGHTCGIHTTNDDHVMALARGTRTARVLVNQNLNEGAGSPRSGMPYTLSLSCGTWGGNITTENVSVKHFMNVTYVSRLTSPTAGPVAEEALFAGHWERYGR